VALTVTDTGVGISPEVQAHLFEPFFTTKEVGKGTGLGLATVHGIITRAGGTVGVYSELGKGTSFKVYLPRIEADAASPQTGSTSGLSAPASATVLVVEDAANLRELTRRLLELEGYRVLVAGSADEASALFDAHPSIDLLLTDVVMPGISGPELATRLTAERADLKVVFMSGYTQEAIVHHGVLKSGVAFIHKPFTAEALGRKVRDALER
jgi:CheY-like chemotaxis protein